jgi:hypothetical protein
MSSKKPMPSNLTLVLMSRVLHPDLKPGFKIDLAQIVRKFKLGKRIIGIKYGKDIKLGKVNKSTQGFYNSITFTVQVKPGREVSAKLCNDLVVHISGLRGAHEAELAARILYSKIYKKGMIPNLPLEIKFKKAEIILMNSGYNSNILINRAKLVDICTKRYKHTTVFDPNSYSGVKLYIGEMAILIFRTGKIIVTGERSMNRLIDGYILIEKILRDNYNEIIDRSD